VTQFPSCPGRRPCAHDGISLTGTDGAGAKPPDALTCPIKACVGSQRQPNPIDPITRAGALVFAASTLLSQ
jgi:hypothetical protein